MKTIQIREFESFIVGAKSGDRIDDYVTLKRDTFELLEQFLRTVRGKDDAAELMSLSWRPRVGSVITAKNYVGLIALKDGTSIEIMPKIHSAVADPDGTGTKRLVMDMLRTLPDFPSKTVQTAGVDVSKLDIFEIFVRMFLDEVFRIAKHGLKCGYETVEENTNCFKGKLLFAQQLRKNLIHKERSFVAYDVFTVNRPENRLLKSTLLFLSRNTKSSKSRIDIKNLLNSFAEVDASTNYRQDFQKCTSDRNMKDYATALKWSRVFLMGESFTSFAGSQAAFALLFPMETLYESYVASKLKRHLDNQIYTVTAQERGTWLFDTPREFAMRPDLVIRRGNDIFVMDTKWKLLNPDKPNGGISQVDMYQMCAYQRKFDAKHVTLLYPKPEGDVESIRKEYLSDDGVTVHVCFVDLFDMDRSLTQLEQHLI